MVGAGFGQRFVRARFGLVEGKYVQDLSSAGHLPGRFGALISSGIRL